jgi:hypothetical protein
MHRDQVQFHVIREGGREEGREGELENAQVLERA